MADTTKLDAMSKAGEQQENQQEQDARRDERNDDESREQGSQRTYTQKDVDTLIALQKAKIPDPEELKAFRAWQAGQEKKAPQGEKETPQGEKDTLLERLSALEAKLQKSEEEAKHLRYVNAARTLGVADAYAEFAVFEIQKDSDGSEDFGEALAGWLKEHPQFEKSTSTSTGLRHGQGVGSIDGVERRFRELNPGLFKD